MCNTSIVIGKVMLSQILFDTFLTTNKERKLGSAMIGGGLSSPYLQGRFSTSRCDIRYTLLHKEPV